MLRYTAIFSQSAPYVVHRTFCSDISVQACNRPRSLGWHIYFVVCSGGGELHESQSINKLRRIVLCLYAGASHLLESFPAPLSPPASLSSISSSLFICPARAQPPRRVSPIGIIRSGSASKRERKRSGRCAIAFRKELSSWMELGGFRKERQGRRGSRISPASREWCTAEGALVIFRREFRHLLAPIDLFV